MVEEWGIPRFFNLYLDPKEEHPLSYMGEYFWVRFPAGKILVDHLTSLHQYPPIRPGTPDPYTPPPPDKSVHEINMTPRD